MCNSIILSFTWHLWTYNSDFRSDTCTYQLHSWLFMVVFLWSRFLFVHKRVFLFLFHKIHSNMSDKLIFLGSLSTELICVFQLHPFDFPGPLNEKKRAYNILMPRKRKHWKDIFQHRYNQLLFAREKTVLVFLA